MSPALKIILSNTYTKNYLHRRLLLLREFLEYQFFKPHQNSNLFFLINEYFMAKNVSRDEFTAFTSWDFAFFNQFKRRDFYAVLKSLEEEASKLTVVVLSLPFAPSIYETVRLGRWFRENVADDVLMDINSDLNLIGGCALVWKGFYHDYSLRHYIEKNKAAVKNEIEEFLKVHK